VGHRGKAGAGRRRSASVRAAGQGVSGRSASEGTPARHPLGFTSRDERRRSCRPLRACRRTQRSGRPTPTRRRHLRAMCAGGRSRRCSTVWCASTRRRCSRRRASAVPAGMAIRLTSRTSFGGTSSAGSWPTGVSQQHTKYSHDLAARVTVTRRHHPLQGQSLAVVSRGRTQIVVRLGDGTSMRMPRGWTDVDGDPPQPATD